VDCTSTKAKLIQSWRYKTLAVIKRHKITYLYLLIKSLLFYNPKVAKDIPEHKLLVL